ncbi:MAG: lysylphosphatidylglycerol synthase transmembrane domain-containing protein [Candidatus Eiseniibacteriota bacterium]
MSGARARPGGKAVWLLALKVLFSIALMAFLFSRIPIASLTQVIEKASAPLLAAAFGLLVASNILGAWQWNQLLSAVGIRIPFWKVCAYYHVGLFFNNFLPANIGGDIARVADAARYDTTTATAFSTVLMDRLVGTVALAGLAVVTTLPAIDHFHLRVAYAALLGFFAFSVTVVWAVFHPGLLPALERLLARIGLAGLKPHLDELAARLADFRDQRGLIIRLVSLAIVVQVARIGVHMLVARALGLSIPYAYFFLFVPLLAVIVSLPISLNGIGVREGAGVVLFGLVGVGRAPAFALQFTTYLVAVAVSLLGGLVFLIRIPHRRSGSNPRRRTT